MFAVTWGDLIGKRGDSVKIVSLSNQDLLALEEESQRVMNNSTAIIVEPDAPETSHQDVIKRLLEDKSQNP